MLNDNIQNENVPQELQKETGQKDDIIKEVNIKERNTGSKSKIINIIYTLNNLPIIISLFSLIISVFSISITYFTNKENTEIQVNQFNMNNTPNFYLENIKFGNNNSINSNIYNKNVDVFYKNNSNHTLKIRYSLFAITKNIDFILRNYYEGSCIFLEIEFNKIGITIDPNTSTSKSFQYSTKDLDTGYRYFHFYNLYETEHKGYYDNYIIYAVKKVAGFNNKDVRLEYYIVLKDIKVYLKDELKEIKNHIDYFSNLNDEITKRNN